MYHTASYALAYSIVPKSGTTLPTELLNGATTTALYTVTNNIPKPLNNGFVKYLPPNVTQITVDSTYPDLCASTFTLSPGESCTLELLVSGAVYAGNTDNKAHLYICAPNLPACASTYYPLNVQALPSVILNGTVQSGGTASVQTITNATVTLYKSNATAATSIATTITDSAGKFQFILTEAEASTTDEIFYVLAEKDTTTKLVTIIGENPTSSTLTINEITTIAAAYSMAKLFNGDQIYGNALGLKIASYMSNNLIASAKGSLSTLIQTSPNADETNSMRSLSSLANLLLPCVQNTTGACSALFAATTVDSQVPINTLEAALSIAHNPSNNVASIYALATASSTYTPTLQSSPDAWTLTIKFNNTGSETCPFGGPAKIAFDANGFLWITNNVIQGTPNSAECAIVLQPNGQPANGSNNTPISPLFGGGLLGAAFGVNIDQSGHVWIGNFGWGSCDTCIPTEGSVSEFSATGVPLSGPKGYVSNILRAQGLTIDSNNNIWIASAGNDRVVVFPNANPNASFYFQEPANSGPFELVAGQDDVIWVSNSTSAIVSRYKLVGSTIVSLSDTPVGQAPKQISLDASGHAWVAGFTDSTIYEMDTSGAIINSYTGIGGMGNPWGVSVDSEQNIWVANFQTLPVTSDNFSVTKLCGNNTANCPTGLSKGDAISPSTGYTVPSAGSEVLLHNGTPLYGVGGNPSYNPLMRLTQVTFDQAGNVWAVNNWKPIPNPAVNPGGDGLVVFLGLAGIPTS
ncbi:MAG: hypothetical protein QNK11_02510 [Legionella sp.]|nr:hypothetical protein [Legionella sp.]